MGDSPFELRSMTVQTCEEQRNADAGLVVDHRLQVGIHLLALGEIGLGACGDEQLVELRRS